MSSLALNDLVPSHRKRLFLRAAKATPPFLKLDGNGCTKAQLEAALCDARALGVGVVLTVLAAEDTGAAALIDFLRDWDQLSLSNAIEACARYLPAAALPVLREHATIESKWFEQWHMALGDPRFARYPNLPWRRFLRRINEENHRFFRSWLDDQAFQFASDDPMAAGRIRAFLATKQKTVSLFPKRWN